MAKKTEASKDVPPSPEQAPILAYKGFGPDFKCRDQQYEVGQTYTMSGKIEACERGFHACESPFDVWTYYGPFDSRYAVVEMGGKIARHDSDTKIASGSITIKAELTLPEFIQRGIDCLINLTKDVEGDDKADEDYAQIGSGGDDAQIGSGGDDARIGSGGYYARIGSGGDRAQIGSGGDDARIGSSGNYARIGSSGNDARIGSGGDDAQIGSGGYYARIGSSGDRAQIGSGGDDARIGSSGNYARIGSSGNYARIGSSGDYAQIEATGKDAVVACAGSVVTFKLGENGCICLPYHDGKRTRFVTAYVGEDGIEAGKLYRLDGGKIVEAA